MAKTIITTNRKLPILDFRGKAATKLSQQPINISHEEFQRRQLEELVRRLPESCRPYVDSVANNLQKFFEHSKQDASVFADAKGATCENLFLIAYALAGTRFNCPTLTPPPSTVVGVPTPKPETTES